MKTNKNYSQETKTIKEVMRVQTVNKSLEDVKGTSMPKSLWNDMWYEGELCCMFADSNLGKSILAVQIADHIAVNRPVMYFDFELSAKQFQMRYTGEDDKIHEFSSNLYRADINPEKMGVYDIDSVILENIVVAAEQSEVKVVIIDNLTYICNGSEKGDAAGEFMKGLMQLKFKYGLSVMIIAHTPKRILSNPISQNDLAGSKRLFNFFDSVFAVGKSAKDESLRYIKHLKCRASKIVYNADNVLIYRIEKCGSFLMFKEIAVEPEWLHLKSMDRNEKRDSEREIVAEELAKCMSIREIASAVGMSKSKVAEIVKEIKSQMVE